MVQSHKPAHLQWAALQAIAAGSNAITLNNANTFTGAVSLSGTNVAINNSAALVLDTSTATGTFNATAGGAITQTTSGTLSVTGASSFNAGSNAVTLTNTGNTFTGAMSLTGSECCYQ